MYGPEQRNRQRQSPCRCPVTFAQRRQLQRAPNECEQQQSHADMQHEIDGVEGGRPGSGHRVIERTDDVDQRTASRTPSGPCSRAALAATTGSLITFTFGDRRNVVHHKRRFEAVPVGGQSSERNQNVRQHRLPARNRRAGRGAGLASWARTAFDPAARFVCFPTISPRFPSARRR